MCRSVRGHVVKLLYFSFFISRLLPLHTAAVTTAHAKPQLALHRVQILCFPNLLKQKTQTQNHGSFRLKASTSVQTRLGGRGREHVRVLINSRRN